MASRKHNLSGALDEQLDEILELGLMRNLREVDSPQGVTVQVEGSECLNFSSNDYLGLANHPLLKEAAIKAIEKYGVGSGASRLICGNIRPHVELEEAIAAFKGTEAALAFSSGYAAAVGTISALLGRDDIVVLDKLCHASLIDGARLSGAKLRIFAHNDLQKLETILKWATRPQGEGAQARRILVITESVFSMDGDISPLKNVAELTHQYGGWLMVDEAHSVGLFGEQRRGLAEAFEMHDDIDIHFGTLGKAVGASGGYVAGNATLINFLINKARSFIFSTAPLPAVAAAATAGIRLIQSEEGEHRRQRVWSLIDHLKSELLERGITLPPTQSAIVPILLGQEDRARKVAAELLKRGIYVPAIRYPTVAMGKARLRVSMTANHEVEQIQQLCVVLAETLNKFPEA
ncbi:MAG TPA: 8-amino-7-oxononanoate synthase [Verrucomicrobiae bacterium]